MIETKTFTGPVSHPPGTVSPVVTLDEKVNAFLAETRAKIIDIKFSVAASGDNVAAAAMVIYERDKYEGES